MANTAYMPNDANAWLASHDWSRVNPESRIAALWHRGTSEVLVPLNTDASDFGRRWTEMLASVSQAHKTSPSSLSTAFVQEGADVCEWAASHPRLIDHTIPVSALHTLSGTVRTSIVAAANATLQPRGYFGHSIPHQARQAADKARAGQTREGSYVIPVISRLPVDPPTPIGTFDLDVALQPFERQVMDTWSRAMSAVHDLAVQGSSEPTTRHVNDSVGVGVSHELCAALADALEAPAIGEISVSFKWGRAIPWHREETDLTFPSEAGEIVRQMANTLKGSPVVGEQRIIGFVRDVHRGEDDEEGRVTLRAPQGGSQRSIRLNLSDQQYKIAGTANLERRTVYVLGTMERSSGRMLEFTDVREFGIVTNLTIEELERYYPDPRDPN